MFNRSRRLKIRGELQAFRGAPQCRYPIGVEALFSGRQNDGSLTGYDAGGFAMVSPDGTMSGPIT
jgi:hypothetical protein